MTTQNPGGRTLPIDALAPPIVVMTTRNQGGRTANLEAEQALLL